MEMEMKMKRKGLKRSPEKLSEFNNVLQGEGIGEVGCGPLCKVNYLTHRGKRIQLARILCFIFIPLFGVWGFTIFSLYDNVQSKNEIEENMEVWPTGFERSPRRELRSKERLMNYISQHRKHINPATTDTIQEIKFYNDIANVFMTWMIENIRDAGFGEFWKSLVAYQKLTRCGLDAGAERAYGVMFYTKGRFEDWEDFELYNKRIHSFKIHYQSAVQYSPLVNPLLDDEAEEIDATLAINNFRLEIRNSEINPNKTYKSLEKAEWLFDNITIRIDSLFDLQEQISDKIIAMLDTTISDIMLQIAVYGILVVLAIGICPVIVLYSESLTSNIAAYSKILVEKSSELDEEKTKSDTILYQMIPKSIAERLKKTSNIDSEFFRSVTLMFSSIVDFTKLSIKFSPVELVELLNYLYSYFDEKIENYDVYKIETINDTYLLASGLPVTNGDNHVSEIAYFAVDVARMIHNIGYSQALRGEHIQLLIGINTGPVSAGIIGTQMLRYCVFGDTVNIASRMMSNGAANKIHVSESSYKMLKKTGNFKLHSRGTIEVKGKGRMNTYWLLDSYNNEQPGQSWTLPGQPGDIRERASLSSLAEDIVETRYTHPVSGSVTQPKRRISYSAMHVVDKEPLMD